MRNGQKYFFPNEMSIYKRADTDTYKPQVTCCVSFFLDFGLRQSYNFFLIMKFSHIYHQYTQMNGILSWDDLGHTI